jgi:glutamine amidotransferase-like uncharacterized protein
MIYVYKGSGVSLESLRQTLACLESLEKFSLQSQEVGTLCAEEIIQGNWRKNARCFVMPGGADVPYGHALNGPGNAMIRDYVESGGVYVGICAGAYYAARRIEFDENGPQEVLGSRELGFFPGTVIGPHWGPYVPGHHCGARAVPIATWIPPDHKSPAIKPAEQPTPWFSTAAPLVSSAAVSPIPILIAPCPKYGEVGPPQSQNTPYLSPISSATASSAEKTTEKSFWYAYVNGGGRFVIDPGFENTVTPIAQDSWGNLVMVGMQIGGGWVFLSSAHWEYDPHTLSNCCRNIGKGGCWDSVDCKKWIQSNESRVSFAQSIWDQIMECSRSYPYSCGLASE